MNESGQRRDIRERMQDIANAVDDHLPKGFGFMVLVFPLNSSDGRANYVSNGKREDVIKAMKEFIQKNENPQDWGKHT